VVHQEYASAVMSACRSWTLRVSPVSSWCWSISTATACTCRSSPCTWSPLYRCGARERPAAQTRTDQWARARKRAAEQVRDVAAELLDLYARRKRSKACNFRSTSRSYLAFANAFPFDETEDQGEAIRAVFERPRGRSADGPHRVRRRRVRQDRSSDARRVRGGRGGQTGRVARTHDTPGPAALTNFRDRFADWAVRVESLSRFGNSKETQTTIEGSKAERSTSSSQPTGCCTRTRASRISG